MEETLGIWQVEIVLTQWNGGFITHSRVICLFESQPVFNVYWPVPSPVPSHPIPAKLNFFFFFSHLFKSWLPQSVGELSYRQEAYYWLMWRVVHGWNKTVWQITIQDVICLYDHLRWWLYWLVNQCGLHLSQSSPFFFKTCGVWLSSDGHNLCDL